MKCIWVKCSESLSNRVSTIIRGYVDHMKSASFMVFFVYHIPSCFCSFFNHCVFGLCFVNCVILCTVCVDCVILCIVCV